MDGKLLTNNKKQIMGLRERKKAKTRAAIQQHALRLFREQGYDATTVDQIAEAAEVSQSTFFRYFPTKEDVVLWDEFDPMIIEAFKAQPAELNPIHALQNAFREVFSKLPAEEKSQQLERFALILSVPDLSAVMLDQFIKAIQLIAEEVAERIGRPANDFAVRNLAGAVSGVMMSAIMTVAEDPSKDIIKLIDDAMAHLEAGLPL